MKISARAFLNRVQLRSASSGILRRAEWYFVADVLGQALGLEEGTVGSSRNVCNYIPFQAA